jgi:hypothetical protein
MSFASVQSQQFGQVMNYSISGSGSSTIGETILNYTGEGFYIYSLSLELKCTGTTFTSSNIKIGTGISTPSEKIVNVLKNDVSANTDYNFNMAGVVVNAFEIYLYASTATINKPVTWTGTLQLIKV